MATNLEKAMQAAKYGPEVKDLDIKGHKFNVKKYLALNFGKNGRIITGRISHRLKGRPDDQVDYKIQFKDYDRHNKTIALIKVDTEEGGMSSILAPIISAGGSYLTGVPLPADLIEGLGRKLGQAVDGTQWKSVASYVIAEIAIRA